MASTNKTTNYELSQYIGTDKPTYLTDYNQDMSKIDAGIHAAKSEADTNANAIGDLSTLTTTAKTSLVAAANEIDADVATNTNNIATNTSNIATNTTHIGTLTNLTTSSKTDLVVAANEINAKIGNLSSLDTDDKTSAVSAINEVNTKIENELDKFDLTNIKSYTNDSSEVSYSNVTYRSGSITLATDSTGSIFKLYGDYNVTSGSTGASKVTLKTSLRPSAEYTISPTGFILNTNDNTVWSSLTITVKTNGDVEISHYSYGSSTPIKYILFPCIYFNKSFGDTPSPQ